MEVQLRELDILTWQWHDAELLWLKALQSGDGELTVCLRTEINPEEDRKLLVALGINGAVIDVTFHHVSQLKTEMLGLCSQREVILDWTFADTDTLHHQIGCSCGSKIDITFREVSIKEVPQ
jgi:hypothetical protein